MRGRWQRRVVVTAVAATALLGCDTDGEDGDADDATVTDTDADTDTDDAAGGEPDADTDTDTATDDTAAEASVDVEDGLYRGNGVVLPVPDGWSMDTDALASGVAVAVSPDGAHQMSAVAADADEIAETGQTTDVDLLLDRVRSQLNHDAEVDEEVTLVGAERAHRLTFLDFPPPQDGMPNSSATMMIAESGDGLLGEFTYSAASDAYDADYESAFVEEVGFDPGSRPG